MALLAAPNISEGRDFAVIAGLEASLGDGVELLDRHSDADHNRTVLTLTGEAGALVESLSALADEASRLIDMRTHEGLHPCVGALDVCPVVYLDPGGKEAAWDAATRAAGRIGDLGIPTFFYGELASVPERIERSYFRNGGIQRLRKRMDEGRLDADAGPAAPHPMAGATLVTARRPLGAFNVELDTSDAGVAQAVASALRESGGGLPGVRAIGLALGNGTAQVSTNIGDPVAVPLGTVVRSIRELASDHGALPVEAELIGLIPEAALEGYPRDVPIRGFDPEAHIIERRLGCEPII